MRNVPDRERRLGEKGQVLDLIGNGCVCEVRAAELGVQGRGVPGVARAWGEGVGQTDRGEKRSVASGPEGRRGCGQDAFSPGPSQPEQLCTLGVGCAGARGLGPRCELGKRSASSPWRESGDRPVDGRCTQAAHGEPWIDIRVPLSLHWGLCECRVPAGTALFLADTGTKVPDEM